MYPGDDRCDELLEEAQSAVSFEELRAAAMGFLLSADEYSPEVLFELVNGDEEIPVGFETDEELQEFKSAVLGLWDKMSKHLQPGNPFAFTAYASDLANMDQQELMEAAELRAVEVDFFLGSLIASEMPFGTEPGEVIPVDASEWLPAWLESAFEELVDQLEGLENGESEDWECLRPMLEEFDEKFAALYPGFVKEVPALREKIMAQRAAARTPASNPMKHVGRNDDCPCGSGKKFKNCCLQ